MAQLNLDGQPEKNKTSAYFRHIPKKKEEEKWGRGDGENRIGKGQSAGKKRGNPTSYTLPKSSR